MEAITFRIQEEKKKSLEETADEYGVSVSEHIRDLIEKGHEYEKLQVELERRRERIETLEDQLARRSQIEDRVDELALELREERETVDAPFFVRWYDWWQNR